MSVACKTGGWCVCACLAPCEVGLPSCPTCNNSDSAETVRECPLVRCRNAMVSTSTNPQTCPCLYSLYWPLLLILSLIFYVTAGVYIYSRSCFQWCSGKFGARGTLGVLFSSLPSLLSTVPSPLPSSPLPPLLSLPSLTLPSFPLPFPSFLSSPLPSLRSRPL